VYIAAVASDVGESVVDTMSLVPTEPDASMGAIDIDERGVTSITPDLAMAMFYADCPPDLARDALRRLRPQAMRCTTTPAVDAAWRTTPSTYVICEDDASVPPELQRHLAERAYSNVVSLAGGHSPFLTQPDVVARVLIGVAAT
jgi:pimeloyl-ACP methyl ester carboxylesterase